MSDEEIPVPTEVFVSIAQQVDGAWLCYWNEQPAGIEDHAARRTKRAAVAWARDVLGLRRIVWDDDTGTYLCKTKVTD